MKTQLASLAAAVGLLALNGQAHAAGPITADYYSNYSEIPGFGILFDTGSLIASSQISSINEFSNPDPAVGNSDPNFPSANSNFGASYSSDITVATTGSYTFTFTTDDAGYFAIDGTVVGSEPGNHLPETGMATLTLDAGVHTLGLAMDNAGGPCCAEANVVLPDGVSYGDPTSTVSAAPEPGAWALMLGGVGILGAFLRLTHARRREDEVKNIATA